MDTAHSQPDAQQPLGSTLRRRADDRILLGLCAGLARSAGISPLAVRLATVLTSFLLLPFVLVAYVVTAVIVPRDDGAALVGTGWRERREVWIALALTLIAAPAGLSIGEDGPFFGGPFGFVFVPLVVLTAMAFLAVRRDRDHAAAQPPVPAGAGPTTTPQATWAPSGARTPVAPGAATGDLSVDATGATAFGAVADAPADGPSFARPGGPPPTDPPTFVRNATPTPPPAPKRPGLTIPVLGAVAMVPAFFAILLASGAIDGDASSWAVMLAVMAVVSAAGAVAIAILRPSYLGAGLLVLLAAALGISSIGVGQFGSVIDDGLGDREYRVSTASELRDPFVLGAGQLDLDLRPLALQPRQRVVVHARLGFGELNIAVPRGTRIMTTQASSASALATTARENGATDAASSAAPEIVLDLRGRGINVRVLTGRERNLQSLDVLAETDLGFWSGGKRDAPFTVDGVGLPSSSDARQVR